MYTCGDSVVVVVVAERIRMLRCRVLRAAYVQDTERVADRRRWMLDARRVRSCVFECVSVCGFYITIHACWSLYCLSPVLRSVRR